MINSKLLLLIAAIACTIMLACTHKSHPHGMPPGQAKKLSGSKSAKPYAPGQRKKQH